ncbi:MAG: hypothetical protein E7241_05070 [Lachnospiraceae bacterium]|jgi:hypothetical protein|nr:hypothetical protein [Lachnospiraceae bacterium]
MALIEYNQIYGEERELEDFPLPTFKEYAAADIDLTFFDGDEHAELHKVDGTEYLVIIEEDDVRQHAAHWEAGAKQNFDMGLYNAHTILYIKAKDYGPKPKVGKYLVLDEGTDHKRTYKILHCEDDAGVYRMTMERVRQ